MLNRLPANPNGFDYLSLGWSLIQLPGIRRYVIMPIIFNLVFFSLGAYGLFRYLIMELPVFLGYLPYWLHWLDSIIWFIAISVILLLFGYFFSSFAAIIASPFNGLLVEQLDAILTQQSAPKTNLIKELPRMIKREWIKFAYYLPRAVILLTFYFIPVIGPVLAPLLWIIFSGWMLTIQYCDYPFDLYKVDFHEMKQTLKENKWLNLQFGLLIYFITLIPIINLIIMPIAVCGATAMWVDRYKEKVIIKKC